MKIFLTEVIKDNQVLIGPYIKAEDLNKAILIADMYSLTIIGELFELSHKLPEKKRDNTLMAREKDPRLKRAGVSGFNKPKRTPSHPTKSHIVVAKEGDKIKTIRFGQQGAKTAGKPKAGESRKTKMKRKSFKARHRKNIAKGKMSAAFWANKVKW